MMDFHQKIAALRDCVECQGDGGIATYSWEEREELQEFLDEIEEGSVYD